jgi:ubiquinol-cytochrome c reductase cytochrome c1 subunit
MKTMKKLVQSILSLGFAAVLLAGAASAEEIPEFPLKHPPRLDWSFAGPFGTWDKAQLQRGLKVYTNVCSACHSMNLVSFRNLEALGYSEAQVKGFAASHQVQDGPNDQGEMFERPGKPNDYFPSPFPNEAAAAYANGGAAPPDFSTLAQARAVKSGFPTFIFDIFTMYTTKGPDYIHALLTGYQDPPKDVKVPEGTYYNPFFHSGISLKMPPPLSEGVVEYDDGTPATIDQYAKDVAAFMMWAAEPHLVERREAGFVVVIFMLVFAGLIFLTKKAIYSRIEH